MYNTDMNMLKVSEFRTKLKECLDTAQDGRAVEVERDGVIFVLSLKGKERKAPWLNLEQRIDELKVILEGMGTPSKNISSAEPSDLDFKKLGITTADKLETYEPFEG